MSAGKRLAIVRGGGDLATGVIYRLWTTGHSVLSLEVEKPMVVRRTVAVAGAIFEGSCKVEDMPVHRVENCDDVYLHDGVSVMVDPLGQSVGSLAPDIVIDCIMAKRNLGTHKDMAPLVVGIGPGFTAGEDVHYVVETKRGHTLGRLISKGEAIPDTGIPGMEMGYTTERLLRSPADGYLKPVLQIGDHVNSGDLIATVSGYEIRAQIDGTLRGLIHPSVALKKGLKIGDVDPRDIYEHCFSITDKALAVAGGVLEGIMRRDSIAC